MKKHSSAPFRPLSNSRGMLTAEFIFSITLCAGICIVLFALNFTLSMSEVAQYIAFSAARAHSAGHVDPQKQVQMAQEKYKELINSNALRPIFTAAGVEWFRVPELPDVRGGGESQRSFDEFYPAYSANDAGQRMPQVGVRFSFAPRLLSINVPFLGSTNADDETYSANVTALLIREPTQKECWDLQIKNRYSAILNLDPRYKVLGGAGANKYVPTEDNGC